MGLLGFSYRSYLRIDRDWRWDNHGSRDDDIVEVQDASRGWYVTGNDDLHELWRRARICYTRALGSWSTTVLHRVCQSACLWLFGTDKYSSRTDRSKNCASASRNAATVCIRRSDALHRRKDDRGV